MNVILEKYGYAPDMEAIDRILTQIQNNLDNYESQENLASPGSGTGTVGV